MKFSIKSIYDVYRNAIRNPKYRWWVITGTLVYLLSPFDISPDFIPIAGQIDDLVIVSLLFSEVSQLVVESLKNKKQKAEQDAPEMKKETVDVNAISLD